MARSLSLSRIHSAVVLSGIFATILLALMWIHQADGSSSDANIPATLQPDDSPPNTPTLLITPTPTPTSTPTPTPTPTPAAGSALDGFDPNANGDIHIVVVQRDGKILIGGEFTMLSPNGGAAVVRNRIARLNPNGTLDATFDPNADGSVLSIAVQADGKILAGGYFINIGGQSRNRMARLDATTGLADSFNPNATGNHVDAIVVQTDGKILASGFFTAIGGQTRNNIARLDPMTGLADSFDPNASYGVSTMAVQSDGKILAGGVFETIGGQPRRYIARLDPTTGLADSFDPSASNGAVASLAVQADGKILVGGYFDRIGGQMRNCMARLDATTGLADSFDPNASHAVRSIAVQADGKILAGGSFLSIGGAMRNHIARLNATTGLADSFDPNANGGLGVNSFAVQADGKILAGGDFTMLAPNGGATITRNRIARLETDGRLDQTLILSIDGAPGTPVAAIAFQPDGKVLIGGHFSHVSGVSRNNIARLNTDGTLDTVFNPNANGEVYSIAIQVDGKILVGGNFSGPNSIGGQMRNYIARLDATTGSADSSFNPNSSGFVQSLGVQANGKILVGGSFFTIGGQARNYIARLDPGTGTVESFNPNADSVPYTVMALADGKILASGFFNNVGGQTRNHIARLDPTTGLADSFNPNASSWVGSLAVQTDGKIVAGGNFHGPNSIGGQMRNYIARLDPSTGQADSFNPNASSVVGSIAMQADRKIIACGLFHSIGGQTRNYIGRLNGATGLADSFDPNADSSVDAIALQADGKILVSGFFNNIGGASRNLFARLSNDTAALQDLAVTRTTINWTLGGSTPQFTRVGFEVSTDNVNYADLGSATTSGSTWTLTGLNLPAGNFYIRARGYYRSGSNSGSESTLTSVRNGYLTPTTVSSTASSTTMIGGTISGSATLSGGKNPTGTITFNVYGPDDAVCGGPVAFSSTSTVNGNGEYSSAPFTPASAGTYRFVAVYSGDEKNASSISACDDANGSVVVSKKSPTITTNASASIILGGSISDSATLAAGYNPTGTITFNLYGPDDTTCGGSVVFSSTVSVNAGNTTYASENFTPAAAGIYRWIARYNGDANNNAVAGSCSDANESVTVTKISPTISTQASPEVFLGGSISDTATLAGGTGPTGTITFALFGPDNETCSGTPAFTSTKTVNGNGNYSSGSFTPSSPGIFRFVAVYSGDANHNAAAGACGDANESVEVKRGVVGNVSTRLPVGIDDNVLIEGFIVQGPDGSTKKIMVRALGPFLTQFGINDALANPTLEIRDGSNVLVAVNNDWKTTQVGGIITGDQSAEISGSGVAPEEDLESAIIAELAPGRYTAVVRGVGNTVGTGLVDAYDLSANSPARVVNFSTRGLVQPGDKLMIGGFIIQNASVRAAIRAIGPSLTQFGITNALPDTTLQLRNQDGVILLENDDWKTDPAQKQELESNGLQPSHDLEAGLIMTIPPGQYTAQMRGKGEASGIGVVEVYFLQ